MGLFKCTIHSRIMPLCTFAKGQINHFWKKPGLLLEAEMLWVLLKPRFATRPNYATEIHFLSLKEMTQKYCNTLFFYSQKKGP